MKRITSAVTLVAALVGIGGPARAQEFKFEFTHARGVVATFDDGTVFARVFAATEDGLDGQGPPPVAMRSSDGRACVAVESATSPIVDSGCGTLTLSIDQTLGTASLGGTIDSVATNRDTLDQIPSTIAVDVRWSAGGLVGVTADPNASVLQVPLSGSGSDSLVHIDGLAELARPASASEATLSSDVAGSVQPNRESSDAEIFEGGVGSADVTGTVGLPELP